MSSKQQFMNRPNIKNLSKKHRESRYRQHVASKRGQRSSNKTRGTKLVRRTTKHGDVLRRTFSPCALDYLMALEAPFSLKTPACVPDLHSIPSKKIRVKTRGTFSTGVTGTGLIVVNNWCNTNSIPFVLFSNATFAGTNVPSAVGPSVNSSTQQKLPYTASQFEDVDKTTGVQARTVGVGLRIRYIGPELARSGQITGFRHPDNETICSLTFDTIKQYETAKTFANNRRWNYVMYRPVKPDEYQFSKHPDSPDNTTPLNRAHEMGFIVTDTSSSTGIPGPAKFEWQIIRFVEFIGNIDNITKTHTDIVGMSHIRNAMPEKSAVTNVSKHFAGVVKKIEDNIGESLPVAGGGALAYKQFAGDAAVAEEEGSAFDGIMAAAEGLATRAAPYIAEAGELIPLVLF
jgi:hypothetical protein